ncbi:lysophospholipid acyltransferase family protein [Pontivivens ytuae]|uniref:Lauroyl acyltransferase n=1 Tax=Pontivivens ytuae TaxID=2789856 RepID=A0A7S9LSW8_9RHOB|nr:lauroyl acyltransferase [Pontivivens ytuae]QPH54691.1 lauroyl acyltransferase [Pontivivens ytuae]
MSDRYKDLSYRLSNGVLRVLARVIRVLPYNRRVALGGWIGRNVISRLPEARRRVERNFDKVLPDLPPARRQEILRGAGDNFGRVMVEEMMMEDVIADPSRFRAGGPGLEVLRKACAEKTGAVIAAMHFGNWEGLRAWGRTRDLEIGGVYRTHNNPYYNEDFVGTLKVLSEHAFPKGRDGTRGLIRHLRSGGIVAILVDQKQSGAPLIDFLGHPAETTTSAAKLAKSMGVPLVANASFRAEDGLSFDSVVSAPIPHGDEEEMMRAVNAQLSTWIMERPEQWFWFHRRWR